MTDTMQCDSSKRTVPEPITLMFVGGGIRFPAFVGALRAIEESGLQVAKIVASSTGAIIASLYASGRSSQDILEESLAVDTRRFKDISIRSMIGNYGVCAGKELEGWLEEKLSARTFSSTLRIPLEIVATDMNYYRPVLFNRERFPDLSLATAATASTLVPGVFGYRALEYGGKKYALIDGSLMTGIVEGRMDRSQKTLVIKVMSKRTLKRVHHKSLTLKRYLHEMLTFSLHAQEKEFLKGGKWKDTILIYCSEISPTTFSLSTDEKTFLYTQGYEQTKKYLDYKWGI
jgi:NTE family protein